MNPDQNTNPNPQETQTKVPATENQPIQSGQQTPLASPQPSNVDAPIPESGDKKSLLKSKRSVIFAIIIGLLVLTVGAVLAFFYLPKLAYDKQVKDCVSKGGTVGESYPPTCITPIPEESADPTADWETYKDDLNAFEFKYPESWKSNSCNKSGFLLLDPEVDPVCETEPYDPVIFNVLSTNYKSIADFEKTWGSGFKVTKSPYSSNAYVANRFLIEKVEAAPGPDKFEIVAIQLKNERVVTFTLNNPQQSMILDQILSTFKFIGEEDKFSNWETYKDNDVSFEIKFPSNWKLRKTYGKSVNNTGNGRISGVDISTDLTFGSTVVANVIDPQGESLVNWVKQSSGVSYTGTETNYTHNGFPAILTEIQREGRPNISNLYYQEKGYIVYLSVNSSLADLSVANEIISTFKFTN